MTFPKLTASTQVQTAAPFDRPKQGAGGMGTVLLLGGLGVGGYFLYRHFKKKKGK